MLVWSGLLASVLVAFVLIARWNEAQQLQPNETGIGPRASASAVSIDYPPDDAPLGVGLDAWSAAWEPSPGGLPPLALVEQAGGIDYWASETTTMSLAAAVDLAVRDGEVEVAQLAVENGAGDDDDRLLAEEVVPRFLAASGAPAGMAESLGLAESDALFGDLPREVTVVEGGITAYLAANRFGFVLGVVGDG